MHVCQVVDLKFWTIGYVIPKYYWIYNTKARMKFRGLRHLNTSNRDNNFVILIIFTKGLLMIVFTSHGINN